MEQLEISAFELRLIKIAVQIIIEDNMTTAFMNDYVQLFDKIQNACT